MIVQRQNQSIRAAVLCRVRANVSSLLSSFLPFIDLSLKPFYCSLPIYPPQYQFSGLLA